MIWTQAVTVLEGYARGASPILQEAVRTVIARLAELRLLEADARALWAVRVLDAWAELNEDDCLPARFQNQMGNEYWECPGLAILHTGATPDAARLAAAEAVWAELPADVRAKLGERP